jgi:hypothetical protein
VRRSILLVLSLLGGLLALAGPDARATGIPGVGATPQQYGDLTFPADEHAHIDGLDYWWGAAEVVTTGGNQYTVSLAYTSFAGYIATGHQITPHQGPYDGQMLLTEFGPGEWGHPDSGSGRFLGTATVYVPGVSERVRLQTIDTSANGAAVDSFERTTLADWRYRFRIDQQQAKVHPSGERIEMHVDLDIDMLDGAPLLAGGRGTWLYGTPDYFGGYPSRSFQYSQAAQTLTGSIAIEQPDGSILAEQVDPARSSMEIVHEYDATPEDIPTGLVLTTATQLHHRFIQEYQGGIPWELMYFDIGNGAQLQLLVQAYHDTEDGTVGNAGGAFSVPTYRVMGTVRLPNGKSASMDDRLFVEHLEYREIVGRVPTTFVAITGQWTQAWRLRVGFPGGTAKAGDGTTVDIPPFDLGIEPFADKTDTFVDADGNGLNQRVALRIAGTWDRCPVDGSGWSELIVNWTGRTDQDPWFTGGDVPEVPRRCLKKAVVGAQDGNGLPFTPPGQDPPLPDPTTAPEGCSAGTGQAAASCTFTATHDGAIFGYAAEPGGWTVTIERAGRDPIVVHGFTGTSNYACKIIQPGDVVHAEAREGSYVTTGNGFTCN